MGLNKKLENNEFIVLAEMEPPKGVDVTAMVKHAKRVKGEIDAYVVPEMSNAVMRMSSLGGAMILQSAGLETVIQVNCRDRNRIALQADLLAASGCGIKSVMAVTGEEPSFGDHHQARAVYDIDLLDLLGVIEKLVQGKDMAGIELSGAPQFLSGTTTKVGAQGVSPDIEMADLNKKQAAGAQFFITPPVFDPNIFQPFMTRIDQADFKIIPTVLLLKSVGMARYMSRNVEHIYIPDDLIGRLQKAGDKKQACVKVAADLIGEFKQMGFAGVCLVTIGWEEMLPNILQGIR